MTTDVADDGPGPGYTLHIDFTAHGFAHAQLIAAKVAEGLSRLRTDIDMYSARVSPPTRPDDVQPVFCGAPGPDGLRCADEPEHDGWHAEGGLYGDAWSEKQSRASHP